MQDVSWGHVLTAVGIIAAAAVLGWVVHRAAAHGLDRMERRIEWELDDIKLDLHSLAAALAALVVFLILFPISELGVWPVGTAFLLVLASSLAVGITVTLAARGLATGWASSLAMGLVVAFLVVSARFDVLTELTRPLDAQTFTFGAFEFSVLDLITTMLAILIVWGVALLVYRVVRFLIRANSAWGINQKLLTEKLSAIAVIAVAVLIVIDIAGLDSTALSVFSGTLGIGIGFGLKNIFSNLVSGLLLLGDRSISPGNTISVDDQVGEVTEVGVRAVTVRTRDHKMFLIPNEILVTNTVENWGYASTEVRERVVVDVAYDSDLDLVEHLLVQAAAGTERVLQDPPPAARITELVSSGIRHELRFWIHDPEKGRANVKSRVYRRVLDSFAEHGVEMPSPGMRITEVPTASGPGLDELMARMDPDDPPRG